jgi:protein ImuB
MTRTFVVWCPDWPVVTALREAGRRSSLPAAVFTANRVQACTAAARLEGVAIGQRRREAQSRCPDLLVFKADAQRDARDFEPVAAAVEGLAPGLEVLRPGLLACPARGPTRYFRGESEAAEAILDTIEALDVECKVGIADSLEVAVLAARLGVVVPVEKSATFCAPLPIGMLAVEAAIAGDERPQLVDLLVRLGIMTLGDYAALPDTKVGTRFGADGVLAHRLAKGLGERAVSRRHIPPDLRITQT